MIRKTIKGGESLDSYLDQIIFESIKNGKALVEKKDQEALSSGKVELEDVIEKLNVIRSGKSLKDEEVLASMKQYLDELDEAEKTALLSFLKGISEVMTAGVEGDKAFDPSDNPAKVKMEKKPGFQKVTIKPNVIKKPSTPGKASNEEDTTPPVPIEPKKK